MIDNFSIALTHGLLLIAAWRLMHRDDLDVEAPPERDKEPVGFAKQSRGNGSLPDA
ncbi:MULTISPECIES: hypothetical protein [Sphingomonadaceae]|uniref:hypothetical protein n=1 Tax=Sphingomonadales TaxID=204457 RepID=UPI0013DD2521|nr:MULTISPECIES: hypothetical protein [Sphingomonadaceae]